MSIFLKVQAAIWQPELFYAYPLLISNWDCYPIPPFERGKGDVVILHTSPPRTQTTHRETPRLPRRGRWNKVRSLCFIGGGRRREMFQSSIPSTPPPAPRLPRRGRRKQSVQPLFHRGWVAAGKCSGAPPQAPPVKQLPV